MCSSDLERSQHALEVLVAVVEVDGEMILATRGSVECGALLVASESGVLKKARQTSGAVGHLLPREAAIAEDETFLVRSGLADCFVYFADGELVHGAKLRCSARSARIRRSSASGLGCAHDHHT